MSNHRRSASGKHEGLVGEHGNGAGEKPGDALDR
jgi:hypothetical protein